ncbi:DUF2752 domain-containing protein [Planctomycetota bacterium]|nr:DUF2752 domain-containing protein [Planctomycetota bacterium]
MRIIRQPSRIRLPSHFEAYCLLVAAGGFYYMLTAIPTLTDAQPYEPTGFIGPFKGGTRSVACLLDGRVLDAVWFSPLAVLFVGVVGGGALHYLQSMTTQRRVSNVFTLNILPIVVTVICFCLGWAFVFLSESYMTTFGGSQ